MRDTDFLKQQHILEILSKNQHGLSKSRLAMLAGVYSTRMLRLMKELVDNGKVIEIKNHYEKNTWIIYKVAS